MESHHIEWRASDEVWDVCQFAPPDEGPYYEPYYKMWLICRDTGNVRLRLEDSDEKPDSESPYGEFICQSCGRHVHCRMWEVELDKNDRSEHRTFYSGGYSSSIIWCPAAQKHVMGPPKGTVHRHDEDVHMCFGCGYVVHHIPARLQPLEYSELVARLTRPSTTTTPAPNP